MADSRNTAVYYLESCGSRVHEFKQWCWQVAASVLKTNNGSYKFKLVECRIVIVRFGLIWKLKHCQRRYLKSLFWYWKVMMVYQKAPDNRCWWWLTRKHKTMDTDDGLSGSIRKWMLMIYQEAPDNSCWWWLIRKHQTMDADDDLSKQYQHLNTYT